MLQPEGMATVLEGVAVAGAETEVLLALELEEALVEVALVEVALVAEALLDDDDEEEVEEVVL